MFIKNWINPKLYRIIEFDYGWEQPKKYGIQYKRMGMWFDVIEEDRMIDAYCLKTFKTSEEANKYIEYLNTYGNGPVTRIIEKIKIS